MVFNCASPDPKGLLESSVRLLRDPALETLGVGCSAPTEMELGGIKATGYQVHFDLSKLLKLAASAGKDAHASKKDLAEAERVMSGLVGKDGARVALLPGANRLGVLFGGDDSWRSSAAKRLTSGGDVSPALLRATDLIAGSNPCMLIHADIGPGLAEMAGWMRVVIDEPDALKQVTGLSRRLGTAPLPANIYWGVNSATWKAGASIDFDGLLSMINSVQLQRHAESRRNQVRVEITRIDNAVKRYASDHNGALPDSLVFLTDAKDSTGIPYLAKLPKDLWGRAYQYEKRSSDKPYRIRSLGADGKEGGTDDDADLDNLTATTPAKNDDGTSPFEYKIF